MDERFLSRGKRIDNGEWVQGYYAKITLIDELLCIGDCYKCDVIFSEGRYFCVDSSTINQCTGLRDKNNVLIFEDDIVKERRGYVAKVAWIDCGFERRGYNGYHALKAKEQEIIGNSHDNPKLLDEMR